MVFVTLANAQVPSKTNPLILHKDEGDRIGNQLIKADSQTGSHRLGVGFQHLTRQRGISMHKHEQEDEVLFIHSGVGVGVVGDERKKISPGTTLFIPKGTWHGIGLDTDTMELFWVASPPHFAQHLREIADTISKNGKVSSQDLASIQRKHGFQDSDSFFVPRLLKVAAVLMLCGAVVTIISNARNMQKAVVYSIGSAIGSAATLFTIGVGYVPLLVVVLVIFALLVAGFIGACVGIGVRWIAFNLSSKT
jgi:mannose-6-phosphate isomerase-like protein (cupin superfamily)